MSDTRQVRVATPRGSEQLQPHIFCLPVEALTTPRRPSCGESAVAISLRLMSVITEPAGSIKEVVAVIILDAPCLRAVIVKARGLQVRKRGKASAYHEVGHLLALARHTLAMVLPATHATSDTSCS